MHRRSGLLLRVRTPAVIVAAVIAVLSPGVAAHADPSLDTIENQIQADSDKLELVIESYNKINEQMKASQAAANAAMARLQPLQDQLDSASKTVGALASSAYKGGSLAEMNALLASGSTNELVDRVTSLNQIVLHTQQEVTKYSEVKAAHGAEAQRLAAIVAQQQKQRAALIAKRAQINKDLTRLNELRKKVYGQIQAAAGSQTRVAPPYVAGKAGVAVRFAYNQLGKPYAWGADGPGSYDCSGLTMAAWASAGVSLPHNAEMQWNALPHIGRSSLRPGDLVFYNSLGHVGIYVGNSQIIHAPHTGDVVKISSVTMSTPYGYARVA